MDLRSRKTWLLASIFTAVSSVAGLRGMMQIWAASIAADLVFVAGSLGVFGLQFWLAERRAPGMMAAAGGGLLGHWLVYATSWWLVVGPDSGLHIFQFVANVGGFGLAFAAVAPLIAQGIADVKARAEQSPPEPREASGGRYYAATIRSED